MTPRRLPDIPDRERRMTEPPHLDAYERPIVLAALANNPDPEGAVEFSQEKPLS